MAKQREQFYCGQLTLSATPQPLHPNLSCRFLVCYPESNNAHVASLGDEDNQHIDLAADGDAIPFFVPNANFVYAKGTASEKINFVCFG